MLPTVYYFLFTIFFIAFPQLFLDDPTNLALTYVLIK
jgi:hypothetical protein